jgi:hypothetical protein
LDKHKQDFLSTDDWEELQLFAKLLQPFENLTKRLQGRGNTQGKEGGYGTVWQILYSMDYLLTKLEAVKDKIDELDKGPEEDRLPRHYCTGVIAAWAKINEYYQLTDKSPAYCMSIALHPAFQFEYFENKWWKRPEWISQAKNLLKDYYDRCAAAIQLDDDEDSPLSSPRDSNAEIDDFDAWGHTTDRPKKRGKKRRIPTEWERWIADPPTREEKNVKDPLTWWFERRHNWPVLSKIALNIFCVPAMSAEPERVFSDGGQLITRERNHLRDDTVEAEMLQHHWLSSGVLNVKLPTATP